MSALTVFVTGTDTGAGKTHVACELLRQASAAGLRCAGYKPVAAGGVETAAGFCNDDAVALMEVASVRLPYEVVNPYLLREAIAPHIAASRDDVAIDTRHIIATWRNITAQADLVVIEGAGGWLVPMDETSTFADIASDAGWPVLLVVAMRLGCLNHALLSAESIARRTRLAGWIANCVAPRQPRLEENIATLRERLPAPLLGIVPPADGSFAVPDPGLALQAVLKSLK